ncbi:HD domain-containing protein [Leptolyngbya sp. GB1-A1]|uniref:HD domain-containing protein n=1 Tax=Leptolyngbya sp. GB1-A1 TaxID=2933908 RepID=UPI0032977D88
MNTTGASVQLTERFEEALIYANRLHANQVRKASGVPYMAHLLSVAALVLEDGGSEDEAIAALLHDAIEDQGGQAIREEIQTRFGNWVVAIVEGCTDSDTVPKPPWKERKLRYLENLQSASPEVVRVSLADKLHNARSLLMDWRKFGSSIWQQFNSDPEQRLWFYQELVPLYKMTNAGEMSEEFARTVQDLCNLDQPSLP